MSGKNDVFQRWLDEYGGKKKLAALLGVTPKAVEGWAMRRNYPRVGHMLRIVRISDLTINDLIRSCSPSGTKLPRGVTHGR